MEVRPNVRMMVRGVDPEPGGTMGKNIAGEIGEGNVTALQHAGNRGVDVAERILAGIARQAGIQHHMERGARGVRLSVHAVKILLQLPYAAASGPPGRLDCRDNPAVLLPFSKFVSDQAHERGPGPVQIIPGIRRGVHTRNRGRAVPAQGRIARSPHIHDVVRRSLKCGLETGGVNLRKRNARAPEIQNADIPAPAVPKQPFKSLRQRILGRHAFAECERIADEYKTLLPRLPGRNKREARRHLEGVKRILDARHRQVGVQ